MYKPGGTIFDALTRIQNTQYVLPAIQREFVWKPEQIAKLFDSLMRGYPFGTFLFWSINPENSSKFKFYGFVRDYHQKDNPHCPDLGILHNKHLTAVLDGQQRLTALNIGLRGSMALKLPHKFFKSPKSFPQKYLYLDLLADHDDEEADLQYSFKFLQESQVGKSAHSIWFKVPDILAFKSGPSMLKWITTNYLNLDDEKLNKAYETLDKLYETVHTKPLIYYYEEEDQEIEKVLNIFIRMNSGGTPLSYSDLLLSIAVSQWSKLDARQEIHTLVDDINNIRDGFRFSKDLVLKAGLMLADISSVGFQVKNFNHENMEKLESLWSNIREAITLTVQLIADFGLNAQTLRADSSILPIAYYLYRNGYDSNYLTNSKYENDRKCIRKWLFRSLLKSSGIWGSGLDTLLTALRTVIKDSSDDGFPVDAIEKVMRQRGKSLTFEEEEIEELATLQYSDKRVFLLLSLLYPFVDLHYQFHIDHIFPRAQFKSSTLRSLGFDDEQMEELRELREQLPNLQLLEGAANISKQATMPSEWLSKTKTPEQITQYCDLHDLGTVPDSLKDFKDFYGDRYDILKKKITELLK